MPSMDYRLTMRPGMNKTTWALVTALGLLLAAPVRAAEPWPSHPIKIIVPAQAAAAPDTAARLIGNALTAAYGQPVIIENRPGAQGMTGSATAKAAAPDGYTFVLMTSSNVCGNPYLRKSIPYDVAKDFEAVGLVGSSPVMFVVPKSLGVKTMPEFIAYAQAHKGKLAYSTPGIGSSGHLHGELVSKAYGLELLHVPYQGGASAINAILADQVQMSVSDLSIQPHVDSGRLVGLALTGNKRWPRLPQVPTLSETGFSGSLLGWMGLMAPHKTPRDIIEKVNAVMKKVTSSSAGQEQLLNAGNIAGTGSPEDMAAEIRNGCPAWGDAAKKANIEPE